MLVALCQDTSATQHRGDSKTHGDDVLPAWLGPGIGELAPAPAEEGEMSVSPCSRLAACVHSTPLLLLSAWDGQSLAAVLTPG